MPLGARGPIALRPGSLAALHRCRQRREDAIAAYRAALKAESEFEDCHYNLALGYESAGDPRRAIRHMAEYGRLPRSG